MKYVVELSDRAQDDLVMYRRAGEKKLLRKIRDLIEDVESHPYFGIGKPEELKHDMAGYWSRRINKQHRMIYKVEDERVLVLVLQLRQHYNDK